MQFTDAYVQFELDQLDLNAVVHVAGVPIGRVLVYSNEVRIDALQPGTEVFGLQHFQVCALIHRRWATMAAVRCFGIEAVTGRDGVAECCLRLPLHRIRYLCLITAVQAALDNY